MTTAADNRFSQDNKRAFRNPWVIGWISMIVIVLGVNALFITLAIITNPGLVVEDYYDKGQDQEKNYIKKQTAIAKLSWQTSWDLPDDMIAGNIGNYRLSIVDKVGRPLNGAKVTLHAYRPSDADADFKAEFSEVAPGVYQTTVGFPLKGIWDLKANIKYLSDDLEVTRRISVAAAQ